MPPYFRYTQPRRKAGRLVVEVKVISTHMIPSKIILIAIAAAGVAATSAAAQSQSADEYQQRQSDLVELASVFGEMHHIRRTCAPRIEGDVWRDRMKRLVDLEQPGAEARERMVKRFNEGYRNAGDHFPVCDRRARDHAAARAIFARRIVDRLSAPLRQAAREADGPLLLTIPQDAD